MKAVLKVAGWAAMKLTEWAFALMALLFLVGGEPLWSAGCFAFACWVAYDNRQAPEQPL